MKQIGLAIAMYSNNEKGQAFPPDLKTLFDTQDLTAAVFVCPSSNDTPAPGTTKSAIEASLLAPGHMSYVYVGDALNAAASPDTVVLYENPADHLNEGMNVLFADFHVEWVSKTEMQSILNQKAAGKKVIVDPSP
jgi:prepilin-type processing-associated H-X9-DG protein